MDQVEQYSPPPNFAKVTDSRYADYQERYGDDSWELDALDPQVLDNLITEEIGHHLDLTAWNETSDRLEREREALTATSVNWAEVNEWLTGSGLLSGNGTDPDEEELDADDDEF
jgi:hypothetical protein